VPAKESSQVGAIREAREALVRRARSVKAGALPKTVGWLRWESLPVIHWVDSHDVVPRDVLQMLIVEAVRGRSPEPSPSQLASCSAFDPRDREELADFLLDSWIAEDLRPTDPVEARRRAEEYARWLHQDMTARPELYTDHPLLGASLAEITAAYLPGQLRRPAGSARASLGILALVAPCAGSRATQTVERYLVEWHGRRVTQAKALLAMLAWVEHPSAVQLLLSLPSRLGTEGLQEEAERQVEALAERKGLTVAELADRSIPTAGFDENGQLELTYGTRRFVARLQADTSIVVTSPEGKQIRSLPPARKSDDARAVVWAKRTLADARAEVDATVRLQTERLHEALRTGRSWTFADWRRQLDQHPVVRSLTQRLTWLATTPTGTVAFRPLDDGTLTTVDDAEVTFPPDATVTLAHAGSLDEPTIKAWQQHFDDYRVEPLFEQFEDDGTGEPDGEESDAAQEEVQ